MAGLRRLCKRHDRMVVQGVPWVWDYAADEPVLESEMLVGSERWKASERVRVGQRLTAADILRKTV